jgi:hypothetical protein
MRHRRSRRRHHRRHVGFGRHFHLRHNPVGEAVSRGDHIKRALLGTVIVGSVATVTVVALDAAIARFAPATMSNNMKNAAKIGIGLLGAVGLGALKVPTSIGAGFGIGAVADGLLGFYNSYVAASVAAAVAPAPVVAPPAVAPGTAPAPAHGALPAGMPSQYAPISARSCAVPARMAGR